MSGSMTRLLRAMGAWMFALAMLVAPARSALASPTFEAPDALVTPAGLELPEPPAAYRRETQGGIRWVVPTQAAAEARTIIDATPAVWSRISRELGGDLDDAMEIRIALNPDDMRALAPVGAPPPAYATGVTYPSLGLILLSLTAPETWERPDMAKLLAHELSHLALHRAIGGAPIPRWFTEGLAVLQARENSIDRIKLLFEANVQGNMIPLSELSRSFPDRPHAVNLAYAESASMVGFLQHGEKRDRFPVLLVRLRRGMPFSEAIFDAYDETLVELEEDWHRELSSNYTAIPLAILGAIWVCVPILLVIGYLRKRKEQRIRLARMADEEAAVDRLERAIEERIREAQRRALLEAAEESPSNSDAAKQLERKLDTFLIAGPSYEPDAEVPTVEHDGKNHVLH